MTARRTISKVLNLGRRLAGTQRPIVLMYHRVAKVTADPWQCAVAPERFARQIDILKRDRNIVPMHWLAKQLREGRLPRKAAAITFDDGYADVFQNALPILRQFGCPATVFITTQAIGDRQGFWWDVLSRIVLETVHLPARLAIVLGGERREWQLLDDCSKTTDGNAITREALHAILHALLKPMVSRRRASALDQLAAWAGSTAGLRLSDRAMTAAELRQLAAADEIEIGGHTLTHPSLPLVSSHDLSHEVAQSCRDCEAMTGQRVTGFAYPFGDCNDACVQAVEASGLQYALTTIQREIGPRTHPFRIPRILAADWDEADFQRNVHKVLNHG
jgi:peptidoglycan/xylan/chitin deacetylase (PgdA/CDA1 family)